MYASSACLYAVVFLIDFFDCCSHSVDLPRDVLKGSWYNTDGGGQLPEHNGATTKNGWRLRSSIWELPLTPNSALHGVFPLVWCRRLSCDHFSCCLFERRIHHLEIKTTVYISSRMASDGDSKRNRRSNQFCNTLGTSCFGSSLQHERRSVFTWPRWPLNLYRPRRRLYLSCSYSNQQLDIIPRLCPALP